MQYRNWKKEVKKCVVCEVTFLNNDSNEYEKLKKIIQSYDFSKIHPAHKEHLRQKLFYESQILTDDELNSVAAAGTLSKLEADIFKNLKDLDKTKKT